MDRQWYGMDKTSARWFTDTSVDIPARERWELIGLAVEMVRGAPGRAGSGRTPSGAPLTVVMQGGTALCTTTDGSGVNVKFSFKPNDTPTELEAPFRELEWIKEPKFLCAMTPVVRQHEGLIWEAVAKLDAEAAERLVQPGEWLEEWVEIWSGSAGPTRGNVVLRVWQDPNRNAPNVVFSVRRGKPRWDEKPDEWHVDHVRVPPDPGEHAGDRLPDSLLEGRPGRRLVNLLEREGVKTVLDVVCLPEEWKVQGIGPEMKTALGKYLAGLGIDPKRLSAILGIDSGYLAPSPGIDSEEPAD